MKARVFLIAFNECVEVDELAKTLEKFAKSQGVMLTESKSRLEAIGIVELWSTRNIIKKIKRK